MNEITPKISEEPLLVSRRDAARMLGNVSTATLARLEKSGRLKAVRLDPRRPTSQAFYKMADLRALINQESSAKPKQHATQPKKTSLHEGC